MRYTFLLLFLITLVQSEASAQELRGSLPAAIRSALDDKLPGWAFAEVGDDIRRFLRERVSPEARPEIIRGDFDGNGRLDYALLITHGQILNSGGEAIGRKVYIAAFLKRGRGYKLHLLSEGGDYLALGKKGTYGYDFHAERKLKYMHDVIESGHFEKTGWAYIYKGGKFRYVYTAD